LTFLQKYQCQLLVNKPGHFAEKIIGYMPQARFYIDWALGLDKINEQM